jgi:DNA-binding GntR family transcriptional regulator
MSNHFNPLKQVTQRGDQVYGVLLEQIVKGVLEPGSRLIMDDLSQQLKVSNTPVREALSRLESKGLVTKYPFQGYTVKKFNATQVRELYEVRLGLECLALQLACHRRTSDQINILSSLQKSGEAALANNDLVAYQEYNQAIHAAIFAASGNDRLASAMEGIALQVRMMANQTMKVPGRSSQALSEHHELINLLEQRDVRGANAVMQRHILNPLAEILQSLEATDETAKLNRAKIVDIT